MILLETRYKFKKNYSGDKTWTEIVKNLRSICQINGSSHLRLKKRRTTRNYLIKDRKYPNKSKKACLTSRTFQLATCMIINKNQKVEIFLKWRKNRKSLLTRKIWWLQFNIKEDKESLQISIHPLSLVKREEWVARMAVQIEAQVAALLGAFYLLLLIRSTLLHLKVLVMFHLM